MTQQPINPVQALARLEHTEKQLLRAIANRPQSTPVTFLKEVVETRTELTKLIAGIKAHLEQEAQCKEVQR